MTAAVAVDLGKTGCRALLWDTDHPHTTAVHDAPGAPGLAADNGVAAARAAVLAAVRPLLHTHSPGHLACVCVGAAGAATAPDAARALAAHLLTDLPTDQTAVTSDAITAHAGALAGHSGVVLAIGTGTVAIALAPDGTCTRTDGWGPWLGDDGSGAWIGLQALRAVLRAHDHRGPATPLTDAAVQRYGPLDQLPHTLTRHGNPARTAAQFAPDVARAAEAGDPTATTILHTAARTLAHTARTAARTLTPHNDNNPTHHTPIAITGGLTHLGKPLLTPLHHALTTPPAPLHPTPPHGTPLDGARLLALNPTHPHEPHITRLHHT